MNRKTEKKFEELLELFISDMERVDCPMGDFLEALRHAVSCLDDRIQCVRGEMGTDA